MLLRSDLVVGITSPIAAGKTTFADRLARRFGISKLSTGDAVREQVALEGLAMTRENCRYVGARFRGMFGNHYWTVRALEAATSGTHYFIDGIRNPEEIHYLRANNWSVIIGIDAPYESRERWAISRGLTSGRPDDPKTPAEFRIMDAADRGLDPTLIGERSALCLPMADYLVVNDGSEAQYSARIDSTLDVLAQRFNLR